MLTRLKSCAVGLMLFGSCAKPAVIWNGVGPTVLDYDTCSDVLYPEHVAQAHEHVRVAENLFRRAFAECDVHALVNSFRFYCVRGGLLNDTNAGEYWGGDVGAGVWDEVTEHPGRWARLMAHEFGHRVLYACSDVRGGDAQHEWMREHQFPF